MTGQTVNGQTNVADAQSLATAGVQKWVLQNGTWVRVYVLQDGLDIGIPYGVRHYPASLDPATGGCRNMTGRVNSDGTVTIWAVTSTISANSDGGSRLGKFETIRAARAGEVFRGMAFAPAGDDR